MAARIELTGITSILLCIAGSLAANAQDAVLPDRLLGFFKSGDYIISRPIRETSGLRITILTEREAQLLSDANKLQFGELVTKYPELKKQGDEAVEREIAARKERKREVDPKKEKVEPRVELSYRFMPQVRVEHVGSDYLLLEPIAPPGKKYVYASSRILTVDWFEGIVVEARVEPLDGE